MNEHASPWPIARSAADAFRPPKRISVADGAEQSLVIQQPGGYSGTWSPTEAPYMIEPMNMLASRKHEAVCFVGPARTGKTMGLLDGWFARNVTCDPGDMLITQMSQEKAREYSKTRIDRAIRYSPMIREKMSARGHDDNTHDKLFKHGMWVKIGWPSATQLSSSDYRYVALTDYDRMPDNIDGEGDAYSLGLKRTQTFLSRGMCMVESSPGRDIIDPHWQPATLHEAPPCSGIIGIYNRSDRRRWYWQCPDCFDHFEAAPGIQLFSTLPPESDLIDMVRTENLPLMADHHAKVVCPHCGSIIEQRYKPTLNSIKTARWLIDGQSIVDGDVIGDPLNSSIAGYWLGGVAAAYQKWDSLLLRYLQGVREYVLSGSELALKTTTNTDQGMPYLPRHLVEASADSNPASRTELLERFHVPDEARFLVATVDVQGGQKSRFIVHIKAFGVDLEGWLVDRYSITESPRGEEIQIDPAGYPEDWDALTDRVINSTYRLKNGKEMRVLVTGVDSGGESGTTTNAYAWYRRLRKMGLSNKVRLLKGGSKKPERPVVEASARDGKGNELRDVKLHIVDTDFFKDMIAAILRRKTAGAGYMHFPDWLKKTQFFDELKSEVKQPNGKWKKIRARNEALDLWVYALAVCWNIGVIPGSSRRAFNWDNPPEWAAQIDSNSNVISAEERRYETVQRKEETAIQQNVPARKTPSHAESSHFGRDDWTL